MTRSLLEASSLITISHNIVEAHGRGRLYFPRLMRVAHADKINSKKCRSTTPRFGRLRFRNELVSLCEDNKKKRSKTDFHLAVVLGLFSFCPCFNKQTRTLYLMAGDILNTKRRSIKKDTDKVHTDSNPAQTIKVFFGKWKEH